jgi:hypothetical protein
MTRIWYAELDDRIRKCEQGLAAGQERPARVKAGRREVVPPPGPGRSERAAAIGALEPLRRVG